MIELLALAAAAGSLCLAVALERDGVSADWVLPLLLPVFALAIGIDIATLSLAAEASSVVDASASPDEGEWARGWEGVQLLLRWCPPYLLATYVVFAVIAIHALPDHGLGFEWSSDQPFGRHEMIGLAYCATEMLFFSVPPLASASRMPGTYADHRDPAG